jgi:hypothetical protein
LINQCHKILLNGHWLCLLLRKRPHWEFGGNF